MWVVQPYLPVLFLCQWSLLLSQFWEITKGDQLFLSDLTYSRNHVYFFIQLLFIENLLCGRYCDSVNLFSLLNNLVSYSLCLLFIYLFIYLLLLFNYSCLHFPHPLPHAPSIPISYPQSFPALALSIVLLYMFPDDPSPSFPCYPLSPSLLITISLFFIPMFLIIFCLLVLLIRFHL